MSRPSLLPLLATRPIGTTSATRTAGACHGRTVAALAFATLLGACGSDAPTAPPDAPQTPQTPQMPPPPPPPPVLAPAPSITLSAEGATMVGGGACLVFYAKSNEDLVIYTGKLEDPLQRTYRVDPAGGQSFVMGQGRLTTLQPAGTCYTKLSGTYTFTFTGTRATGGAFTATAVYTQGSV